MPRTKLTPADAAVILSTGDGNRKAAAQVLGSITNARRARASRANGKLSEGRPPEGRWELDAAGRLRERINGRFRLVPSPLTAYQRVVKSRLVAAR
jgi:hypothetical protein